MTDKEFTEYARWVWTTTGRMFLQAVAIYGGLLGAYWLSVG